MEPGERGAYEQSMEQDQVLLDAVLREKQLLEALTATFDARAKEEIGQVHRQLQAEGFFEEARAGSVRQLALRIVAVAAVILLCAGIWWFAFQPEAFDPVVAFQSHFEPETTEVEKIIANLTSVGFTPEMSRADSLREALSLYRKENYSAGTAALGVYLQAHPQSDTALFYLALAELSQTQYEAAAARLSTLVQGDGGSQRREAQWYLALCCLQLEGRLEEAQRLFEQLGQDESFDKQAEAQSLARALEEMLQKR